MQVICIESEAFYSLIQEVYARLKATTDKPQNKWLTPSETMQMLNIKSKTSLLNLRQNGKIRYSQRNKLILYDRDSIEEYLNKHAQNTF